MGSGGGGVNNELQKPSWKRPFDLLNPPLMFYLFYLLNVPSGKQWSRAREGGSFFEWKVCIAVLRWGEFSSLITILAKQKRKSEVRPRLLLIAFISVFGENLNIISSHFFSFHC